MYISKSVQKKPKNKPHNQKLTHKAPHKSQLERTQEEWGEIQKNTMRNWRNGVGRIEKEEGQKRNKPLNPAV